jgi:hypothetical protein
MQGQLLDRGLDAFAEAVVTGLPPSDGLRSLWLLVRSVGDRPRWRRTVTGTMVCWGLTGSVQLPRRRNSAQRERTHCRLRCPTGRGIPPGAFGPAAEGNKVAPLREIMPGPSKNHPISESTTQGDARPSSLHPFWRSAAQYRRKIDPELRRYGPTFCPTTGQNGSIRGGT